jgi:hypothetical protein
MNDTLWFLCHHGKILHYGAFSGKTSGGHFLVEDWVDGTGVQRTLDKALAPHFKWFASSAELGSYLIVAGILKQDGTPATAPEKVVTPALVCATTGHRPDKLPDKQTGYKTPNPYYDLVVHGMDVALNTLKPDYVITGMALGVDQWMAELCINKGIPFVAAIPFDGQEKPWPSHSQAKYHLLLSKAYAKYVISPGGYESWKMQTRNEWMVKSCHHLIAVWNGTPGGTANCVAYATQVGKPIYYVPLPPIGMPVGEFFEKTYTNKGAQPQAQQSLPAAGGDGTKRIVEL